MMNDSYPKVQLEFKVNLTDYIRYKFWTDTQHNMRCGYHPSDPSIKLTKFQVRSCETLLIDEK